MITANDVLTVLRSNYDTSDYPLEELLGFCDTGLKWVLQRLRPGVSGDNPLITRTAASIARFQLFTKALSEPEKYKSYRVGDITVTNNPSEALKREGLLRDLAIAEAATILIDGGFFCSGK